MPTRNNKFKSPPEPSLTKTIPNQPDAIWSACLRRMP
jgi:hypothetical protein